MPLVVDLKDIFKGNNLSKAGYKMIHETTTNGTQIIYKLQPQKNFYHLCNDRLNKEKSKDDVSRSQDVATASEK